MARTATPMAAAFLIEVTMVWAGLRPMGLVENNR
jgi:hypothetical protein